MRTRSLPVKLGAVTIAAALTLAACGSDDEATSDVTDTTEQATEAPETTEAPAEASETIVDIAAGNEDFSTLVTAVTEAELVETLSGEGPFTVFAPTNEAFDALP
ncbi:MAG: fasciclin domain-containing protein, partial [Acidimicrobiales bacterium]|nr:fasciclin domain-containing protein [Acidimicrobiales bacterium]